MKLNKGDVILLFILAATAAIFGINEFNILNGYEQLTDSGWNIFGIIFGGELLTFALYRIGKQKYGNHSATQEEESEEEEVRGRYSE